MRYIDSLGLPTRIIYIGRRVGPRIPRPTIAPFPSQFTAGSVHREPGSAVPVLRLQDVCGFRHFAADLALATDKLSVDWVVLVYGVDWARFPDQ